MMVSSMPDIDELEQALGDLTETFQGDQPVGERLIRELRFD